MKLSRKAEYALRALTELAMLQDGEKFQAQELARRENISVKFLEQILLSLTKAGILQSRRGAGGGYLLNRSPDQISLGEVIRLIDGPFDLLECVAEPEPERCACGKAVTCGLRSAMIEVRDALAELLGRITLADICARTRQLRHREAPLYNI